MASVKTPRHNPLVLRDYLNRLEDDILAMPWTMYGFKHFICDNQRPKDIIRLISTINKRKYQSCKKYTIEQLLVILMVKRHDMLFVKADKYANKEHRHARLCTKGKPKSNELAAILQDLQKQIDKIQTNVSRLVNRADINLEAHRKVLVEHEVTLKKATDTIDSLERRVGGLENPATSIPGEHFSTKHDKPVPPKVNNEDSGGEAFPF